MRMRSLLAIAALSVAAAACGSDSKSPTGPGEDDDQSSFTATVTGGISKSISGAAAFVADNTDDEVGFAFGFGNEGDAIIGWRATPGVLPVGQHTVANYAELDEADIPANHLVISFVVAPATGGPRYCLATGGTVTVTSSSANRVRGSLQVNALCSTMDGQDTSVEVAMAGQFDAFGGTVTVPGQ